MKTILKQIKKAVIWYYHHSADAFVTTTPTGMIPFRYQKS